MDMKAMKYSLKKNCQEKHFCEKKFYEKNIWTKKIFQKFSKVPKFGYFPNVFRTHLIHQPFVSNATSCMMQQLLLHYQIPQYDRHHFPMTGILLIIQLFNK